MSVFATHPKTRHKRNLFIIIGLCVLVGGAIFATRYTRAPQSASLYEASEVMSATPIAEPTETVFPQPREIDWVAGVLGVVSGGRGLALKRSDTGDFFQAYGTEEQLKSITSGPVHIRGRWTGISCAYQQTLFEGHCTPTVDIDVIEILPLILQ